MVTEGWRLKKLTNYRVTMNSRKMFKNVHGNEKKLAENDVVLNEKCFVRQDAQDLDKECGDLQSPEMETTVSFN